MLSLALLCCILLHCHLRGENRGQGGQAFALALGVRLHHALANRLHAAGGIACQGDPLLCYVGSLQGDALALGLDLPPHFHDLLTLEPQSLLDYCRYHRLRSEGRGANIHLVRSQKRVVAANALAELAPVWPSSAVQRATNKLATRRLAVLDQGRPKLVHELV